MPLFHLVCVGDEGAGFKALPVAAKFKLFFEHALEAYDNAYGLRYASLRYFNAVGADESGEIGELHSPETHLIPLALEVALGRRDFLPVYGSDYPTADGTCIRDYVHVSDLAEAHVLALRHLLAEGNSLALNLGTGRGHSVQEIVRAVESTCDSEVPLRWEPRRPGDPPVLVGDPGNAPFGRPEDKLPERVADIAVARAFA